MAADPKKPGTPDVGTAPRFPLLRNLLVLIVGTAVAALGARYGLPVSETTPADEPETQSAPAEPVKPTELLKKVEPLVEWQPVADRACGCTIAGATEYPTHGLVRLQAQGTPPGAALVWKVTPRAGVDRATTSPDRLQFSAPPGVYEVDLMVLSKDGDELSVQELFTKVTIGAPKKDDPKKPEPEKKEGKPDAVKALAQIRFGTAGCTATVVAPRRSDGRWDVLTASHCVPGVGAKGTMKLSDGRTVAVRVVVHETEPDVAWLVTEDNELADLPYAVIAKDNPAAGVKVWHKGFGVDKPGNREDGEVTYSEQPDGKTSFILSVSPGDSGGGIFRSDTDELVATVCCTQKLAQKAPMSAGGVRAIRATRPGAVRLNDLPDPTAVETPQCRALSPLW